MPNTKNIYINAKRPPANIPLGRQGENLATCVIFDCAEFAQLYGDGTAELLHELKDGTVYPVAIQQDGASVSWDVSASDTATVGSGRAELRWYVGDTLAKSAKFRTSVSSALADSTTETPPEPQQSWVDKVLQAAQEIKDGAISDEKLAAAIAAYLEEHPIDAGLDEAALAAYLVENNYLTDAALANAVTQALAEAKASGQFDGDPGVDGTDGGYYAPSVDDDGNLTWTASADNMPAVTGANIKGPQGNKGETGATGAQGPAGADGQPGADGVTPNIQIGVVETLQAGNNATASITGTTENPLLNLGIPKGADGTGQSITAEQLAQIAQNTADITDLKESLVGKLNKPETAKVGQIFKVQAVNEDGTLVLEAVDMPSGGVTDVQINGSSIVEDGVANMPRYWSQPINGIDFLNANTKNIQLRLIYAQKIHIDSRADYCFQPIAPYNIDYAVKVAMCDGKGAAWTDAERIAALLRMGCTVDENGFVHWTAQEVAE